MDNSHPGIPRYHVPKNGVSILMPRRTPTFWSKQNKSERSDSWRSKPNAEAYLRGKSGTSPANSETAGLFIWTRQLLVRHEGRAEGATMTRTRRSRRTISGNWSTRSPAPWSRWCTPGTTASRNLIRYWGIRRFLRLRTTSASRSHTGGVYTLR